MKKEPLTDKAESEPEIKADKANEPATEKLDSDAIEQAVLGVHIPAGGPEPETEPAGMPAAELWGMLWQTACGILAGRRGAHWRLTPEEAQALGAATDPVAEKWLPDFDKGPEAALIITAAMVIAPRVAKDAEMGMQKPPMPDEQRV